MPKVEFLGSSEIYLSENKRGQAGFFRITPEIPSVNYTNHHILLADVSGSMSGSINNLKDRIIATLKALLQMPDSYVSIITYSGHNQSKRIVSGVKCEEKAYLMADVWNTVEEELHIKSVTVISEPLEQSIKICRSLTGICNKHHIALFTDGCLVPTEWAENTERQKCFAVAEICQNEGIYLNAVGFGQYYDRGFLKDLVAIAGNGTIIHIDEVKDYSDVILNMIRSVNAQKLVAYDISVPEGRIFNVSAGSMNGSFSIRSSNTGSSLFVALNAPKLIVDKDTCIVDKSVPLTDTALLDDLQYALASFYLNEEDIDSMEFIIKALGDIALFEKVRNCYSFTEIGNAANKIAEAFKDKAKRFLKGRYPIVDAPNEKLCILEILREIIEDPASSLYWDTATPYHRITQRTGQIEDGITFKRTQTGLVPVTGITIGSEKLNIGIKVRIDGEVTDSISGMKKEACIYRDYNIVNSGNINVPYINAKLSEELFQKFQSEGLLEENGLDFYEASRVYTVRLQGIKSTNKRILKSMTMTELADSLYRIAELKCRQWALNQLIKEITSASDKLSLADMPQEEQEIRRILRIDINGIYTPSAIFKDNESPFEIYPAVFLTWDIVKFPEKKTKEHYLNSLKEEITARKFRSDIDEKALFDFLSAELAQVRSEMRKLEFRVNAVRIASAITNKSPFLWEETGEKAKTCTDKILNRNMVVGGKLKFCRKTIAGKTIEQQKWVQLIKCN